MASTTLLTRATFADIGVPQELLKGIESQGWEYATHIQKDCIPLGLSGRDVVGQARTGSGKTGAFGVPLLARTKPGEGTRSLILTPTRELASQVTEDLEGFATGTDLRIVTVYGGVGMQPQIDKLRKGVEIVVATPGRALDLSGRGELDFSSINCVVLDEADRMLDMGFFPDVNRILKEIGHNRQTMLFSATFPAEILDLVIELMNNPEQILSDDLEIDLPDVELRKVSAGNENRMWALGCILKDAAESRCIVFSNTKRGVDLAVTRLNAGGIECTGIHGDHSQAVREKVLDDMRSGTANILVATDVAARGLDIDDIDLVINLEPPHDADTFVHRIGRSGRMDAKGVAWTILTGQDHAAMEIIASTLHTTLTHFDVPEVTEPPIPKRDDYAEFADGWGMAPLHLNIGRNHGVNTGMLTDLIRRSARIDEIAVGDLQSLEEESCIVTIHVGLIRYVIERLRGREVNGVSLQPSIGQAT